MIPETIGRYEVQCLLGEGSFGQVFAARDPLLERGVAIKVLRSMYAGDPTFMARFHAEAASLARLSHANITAIYDVLHAEDHHGMVMELVQGHTLEHVLRQQACLRVDEALAIAAQAIAGLGYIHRLGVVHRDIKPANVMLTGTGTIKIMDFGIARMQGATRLTMDGSAVGTLAYASPEQIRRGEGASASDQYSLACMIYEMLSGNPPFDAQTEFELMQAQIAEPPRPISQRVADVPAAVEQALTRALAKEPGQRFDSVEHFGRALGLDAIQPRATDIAHGLIKRSDPIPPIPERAVARSSNRSVPSRSSLAPSPPPRASPPSRAAGRLRQSTPFVIMGTAAGIAAAVGIFIFLDSSRPMVASAPSVQVAAASAHADPVKPTESPPRISASPSPAPAIAPLEAPPPPVVISPPVAPAPPPVVISPPVAPAPPPVVISPPVAPAPPPVVISPPVAPAPPPVVISPPVAPAPPPVVISPSVAPGPPTVVISPPAPPVPSPVVTGTPSTTEPLSPAATAPPAPSVPPPVVTAPPSTVESSPAVTASPSTAEPPLSAEPSPSRPTISTAPQADPATSHPGTAEAGRPPPTVHHPLPGPRPGERSSDRSPEPIIAQGPTDLALAPRGPDTSNRLESFSAAPSEPFKKATPAPPAPPPANPKMPTEPPVYQGKVEDWMGGNMLFVQSPTGGVKKADLYLYGIIDKGGTAKEAQETRNRLEAYARGRVIKCWMRQEDNKPRNLCFLDNKDLALWALEQKLVKPSKNAPPEYLAAAQK